MGRITCRHPEWPPSQAVSNKATSLSREIFFRETENKCKREEREAKVQGMQPQKYR